MAAPTAPTLSSVCTEGLKKAGYSTSSAQWTSLLSRAQDEWVEEIKNDIYTTEKQLNVLQTSVVQITTGGINQYSLPSDFGIIVSMTLLDGSSGAAIGTFQTGSTTGSWILDSSEDVTAANLIGKEIIVYYGTAKNQIAQVTAYNATTKTASVTGCTVAPVLNDLYMIVDSYTEIHPDSVRDYDNKGNITSSGTPVNYHLTGNPDGGGYLIYPNPYRSNEVPWGIKIRYYADLTRLDLASAVMTTIYRRWRNVFVQGVYAKTLQESDDSRYPAEMNTYFNLMNRMIASEKYGVDSDVGLSVVPGRR